MSIKYDICICPECSHTIPENEIPVFIDGDGWNDPKNETEYCPKCGAHDSFYEIESFKQYQQNQEPNK